MSQHVTVLSLTLQIEILGTNWDCHYTNKAELYKSAIDGGMAACSSMPFVHPEKKKRLMDAPEVLVLGSDVKHTKWARGILGVWDCPLFVVASAYLALISKSGMKKRTNVGVVKGAGQVALEVAAHGNRSRHSWTMAHEALVDGLDVSGRGYETEMRAGISKTGQRGAGAKSAAEGNNSVGKDAEEGLHAVDRLEFNISLTLVVYKVGRRSNKHCSDRISSAINTSAKKTKLTMENCSERNLNKSAASQRNLYFLGLSVRNHL